MRHDCDLTREGFPDLLFGEAEPSARSALLEEVARCEDCAREYRTLAETLQVFDHAAAATLPAEDFWPGYGERLRMRIENEIRPNFWGHASGFAGEYRLTFVEDEGLARRLARELKSVANEAELSWPEFRRDPFGFTSRSVTAYTRAAARFFSQRDVALATLTSFVAISILVVTVAALERYRATRAQLTAAVDNSLEFKGWIGDEIPREQPKPRDDAAGTNVGKGGGSKQKYEAAHGGGGGGRQEELPVSHGKPAPGSMQDQILPPSAHPPAIKMPLLPVQQTVKGDPALLPDLPAKAPYGDMASTSTTPSDGPGAGGGQGTGNGTGQGSGDGKGFGPGRGENVGGGDPNYGGGGPGLGGGGERTDYSRNFKPHEVSVRAVIISKPEPGFTEDARRENVTGTVRLRAVLSASGDVTNISVIKGLSGGLTEKAITAAKQIKFRPATKDGHTVSQYVTLEYSFNIY
jgi:TonB family protein